MNTTSAVRVALLICCCGAAELNAAAPGRAVYAASNPETRFDWTAPAAGSTGSLGTLRTGSRHLRLTPSVKGQAGTLSLLRARWTKEDDGGQRLDLQFRGVHITVRPRLAGHALTIDVEADQPVLTALTFGKWPATVPQRGIYVPYYTETPVYFPSLNVFGTTYFDWTLSRATRLTKTEAEYAARTDGSRVPLRERYVITLSGELDDVLPVVKNSPSPWMERLAGRVVLDFWGPPFARIAEELRVLERAGIRNCVVLIHNWQHQGYDNGLPGHLPSNPALGGDQALREAIAAAAKMGCLAGVHENYVDYYPNYENYTAGAVALTSSGKPLLAWLNTDTGIQSLATKPTWFVKNAAGQSPEIHKRYATSASFIDVNSSVVPWWRSDMDQHAASAGEFAAFAQANADLWTFERQTHEGPVFGEGNDHWFWSGLLDGVEAQFGDSGNPAERGAGAPLFVDFDVLRLHPLQVNHGMGYYERWLGPGETLTATRNLDAYRMQEVIFGHAPYAGRALLSNPAQVLIEQNLIGAVSRRTSIQRAVQIRHEVGGEWVGDSAAAKAGEWSRTEVTYANGDVVVANGNAQLLHWHGLEIPQYGWALDGPGVRLYSALRNATLADYAETPDSIFANARNQTDLRNEGSVAQITFQEFRQTGSGLGEFHLSWHVLETPGKNFTSFVHFVPAATSDSVVPAFQADHFPALPASRWLPGTDVDDRFPVKIPPGVPDGSYVMLTGLFSGESHERARLAGTDIGKERYRMGVLTVSGSKLSFEPEQRHDSDDARMNSTGKMIDFGPVRTDGLVSLERNGEQWELRALPRWRAVNVQLSSARFGVPEAVVCDGLEVRLEKLDGFRRVPVNGAMVCRWPAASK